MGKVAVDVAVFFVYVLASLPWLTGVAVHEWIGLGLVLAVFAHCVQENAGFVRLPSRRA